MPSYERTQAMKCERCGEKNPAEIHTCSPQRGWQGLTDEEKEYFRTKPISEKLFKKRFIKIAHAEECFLCLDFQSQDEEINRIECEFGLATLIIL